VVSLGSSRRSGTAEDNEEVFRKIPAKVEVLSMASRQPKTALPKGPLGGVLVVLIKDVPRLGKSGDVVEVRPGLARNYLFPYGFAAPATSENLKRVERLRRKLGQLAAQRRRKLEELAQQLARMEIHVEAAANELGHLYGSVGPEEIARAVEAHGFTIKPEMVKLEGVIKQTGLYTVKIRLAEDLEPEISLWVVPLGEA
jgi:large subunit ribosomal protein L9